MNLKRLMKRSQAFSALGYFIRDIRYERGIKKYLKYPMKQQILFNSFNGRGYADNPKAIAECIHEMQPEVNLLWVYSSDEAKNSLPQYIVPVKFESEAYFEALATSAVWVFNVLVPSGTIKRKEQLYIQTWHGDRAFKKILNDADADNKKFKKIWAGKLIEPRICDYFTVGSEFGERMAQSAFGYRGALLMEGCPRNDCLLTDQSEKAQTVRRMLNLSNEKVLLYAPTFRDHSGSGEVVTSDIQLEDIIHTLEERDHWPWVCLMRAHSGTKLQMKDTPFENSKFIDVTMYPDIADLMIIADMMISDYSSCATDFALTGKAVILYQDDYELYTSEDRTLYFEMEKSPFMVAHNVDEVKKLILTLTDEAAKENDEAILKFYGTFETGKAAKRASDLILKHVLKK